MKKILFLIFISFFSYAKEFSVATYNVENLFDMKRDGTEYKEYIPNHKSKWSHESYNEKLKNISKVINDINADIIALQEIESKKAFNDLLKKTPQYKYSYFFKYKKASIGLGIFSKYPTTNTKAIGVRFSRVNRPILKISLNVSENNLIIYNNHWPSKRNKESTRIAYAKAMEKELKNLSSSQDYIILGDLNSNYNEYQTFKNGRFNDTHGLTGINDILLTKVDDKYISSEDILNYKKTVHFNPWLELKIKDRFSYKFRNKKETPDHIILPKSMFDNKGISYIQNSFQVFKPKYLINNRKINRWLVKNGIHKNKGYSDHLPLIASFSTTSENKTSKTNYKNEKFSINSIYENSNYSLPKELNEVFLLYKHQDKAILKQENNRAIFLYKDAQDLEFDKLYKLQINRVKNFHGLLEIFDYEVLNNESKNIDIKSFYVDGNNNDILDLSFQNEIVTNLQGIFKNNYLEYKFKNEKKKIYIYVKDKTLLPKNGQKINILTAHLGYFKTKPQLIFYKKSDYEYVD